MGMLHSTLIFLAFASYSTVALSQKISLNEADFKLINEKLALHLELEPLEKVTGYYTENKGKLHGKFELGEEYTGHNVAENVFYLYKNKVKGSFNKGQKNGEWLYSHVFDDGLDIFERHNITIKYINGLCVQSSFNGVIGHIMPISNYTFSSPQLCTPSNIREKAWEIWSENYNKTT